MLQQPESSAGDEPFLSYLPASSSSLPPPPPKVREGDEEKAMMLAFLTTGGKPIYLGNLASTKVPSLSVRAIASSCVIHHTLVFTSLLAPYLSSSRTRRPFTKNMASPILSLWVPPRCTPPHNNTSPCLSSVTWCLLTSWTTLKLIVSSTYPPS